MIRYLVLGWLFVMMAVSSGIAGENEKRSLDLTIYQHFAWVNDSRQVHLPAGTSELTLHGIARQFDPGSLQLELDGKVLGLRTHFANLDQDKVYQNLKGEYVRLISEGGELIEGELVAVSQGKVYVRNQSGGYTMIPNPHNYRMEFDQKPFMLDKGAGIQTVCKVDREGAYSVDIYYLVHNVSWNMDYSIILDEKQHTAKITGLATIKNHGGVDFEQANIRLVAGDINIAPRQPFTNHGESFRGELLRSDGDPRIDRFSDYYVFEIPDNRHLPEGEMIQIPLMATSSSAYEKKYSYVSRPFSESSRELRNVAVSYHFKNKTETGLGKSLPAGDVRIYLTHSGEKEEARRSLLGQDNIPGVAVGDPFHVTTGRAFDIGATERVVQRQRVAGRIMEEIREITVQNGTGEKAAVSVEIPLQGRFAITEETESSVSQTADRAVYELTVPAGGEKKLQVTIRHEQ